MACDVFQCLLHGDDAAAEVDRTDGAVIDRLSLLRTRRRRRSLRPEECWDAGIETQDIDTELDLAALPGAATGNAPILSPRPIEQTEEQTACALGLAVPGACPLAFGSTFAGALCRRRSLGCGSTTMSRAAETINRRTQDSAETRSLRTFR